jgi:hypothetical protein
MNIIDIIEDYCTNTTGFTSHSGITYIMGTESYVNAVADGIQYEDGQLIMLANFNAIPVISDGRVTKTSYPGLLGIGRKRESDESVSSLDETYKQKYDRRLRELSNLIVEIISEIACSYELDVQNINIKFEINNFDLNADFVMATLTFIQE